MPDSLEATAPDIHIDFSRVSDGPTKRLHGVNNGPIGYGSLIDVSHHYEDLRIPYVRLHDPNWPHPREVDIPCVFPDPDADPDDPRSYAFARTDDYIRGVLDTGAQIIYRLGVSIEHTKVKTYTHPPTDYERWARVCLGIINHYNHGWAGGYQYGIRHWEIWCEPDVPNEALWSGTPEQYFELYRVAASAIKASDEQLMVGGPAAARADGDFARRFVAFCAEERLPLDFFSWHVYTDHVSTITAQAKLVRDLLDAQGLSQTESHLNEWNYLTADFWGMWRKGHEQERSLVFSRQKGPEGAAFAAATLIALADSPVDVATYYDGQPSALFCGLFDPYGVPQKTFFAFKAFQELCDVGNRVETTLEPAAEELFAGAAMGRDDEGAILISKVGGPSREHWVRFDGLTPGARYECDIRIIDAGHDLTRIETAQVDSDVAALNLLVEANSVLLLTLRRA